MGLDINIKADIGSGNRRFSVGLSFSSGEAFTVLHGPSGSGKTLTLKCIAGLLTPASGRIEVAGRTLFDSGAGINLPSRERRLGYVFQDYALFPHLTVAENIGFAFMRPGRRLTEEERKRVSEALEAIELERLSDSRPGELSGGQRQRVAIARALVFGPDALLLDEPFSALDTGLRARMRAELKAVQERFQIPVLLVTHDPADIEAFRGTVVNLTEGNAFPLSFGKKKVEQRKPALFAAGRALARFQRRGGAQFRLFFASFFSPEKKEG